MARRVKLGFNISLNRQQNPFCRNDLSQKLGEKAWAGYILLARDICLAVR